MKKYTYN